MGKLRMKLLPAIVIAVVISAIKPAQAEEIVTQPIRTFGLGTLEAVAYSPDGRHIATCGEAKDALLAIREQLEGRNQSAAASLDEGFDETLTLHRLGVFGILGRSLKTINCVESLHAMIETRCRKVCHWKNSSQKQRWLASALLDIEPRLRRVRGWRSLGVLREAIKRELGLLGQEGAA